MRKYPEMANIVKCVLTLSHGQAGVERSFSLRTGLLEDNMEADSLNARSAGCERPYAFEWFETRNHCD